MSTKEQDEKKQDLENATEKKKEESKAKPPNSAIVEKFDQPDLSDI